MARLAPPPAPTATFQKCIRKSHYLLPKFRGSFHLLLKPGNTLQLVQNRESRLIRHFARNHRQAGKKMPTSRFASEGSNSKRRIKGQSLDPSGKNSIFTFASCSDNVLVTGGDGDGPASQKPKRERPLSHPSECTGWLSFGFAPCSCHGTHGDLPAFNSFTTSSGNFFNSVQ